MNNIRFNYLYRDGANFKAWGEVIFSNPDRLPLGLIEIKLHKNFLPDKLFIASQISIPETFLFLEGKITSNDHCYHEFNSVENCQEETTDSLNRSIFEFLNDVEKASIQGWKAFDILERI